MADSAVHALTQKTTLVATDEIYLVQSPYGSGDDRRAVLSDLDAFISATASALTNKTKLAITGGTVTSSTPVIDATQTWNSGGVTFTGWKLNVTDTASASASLLMDLQVGGSSKLNILKSGNIQFGSGGILSSGGYYLSDSSGNGGSFDGTGISLKSNGIMQWANSSNASGTKDVILARDAANTLALRNSTNAQTFNVYETYTDGSNYSRVTARFAGGDFEMLVNAAGTGGSNGKLVLGTRIANKGIDFYTANLQRWNIDGASGSFLAGTDNTYDIGASGATRPRTGYFGTSVVTPLLTSTGAVQAYSGTAIPAGGTTGSGFKVSSTSNFGVFFGSGAPSLSAAKGSLYLRSDGSGTTDRAYINTDGSTTWTALTTAA